MPIINFIPERYESGFKKLSTLTGNQFSDLKDGLSLTALTVSLSSLADKVAEVKKLKKDLLYDIFKSVGSLLPFVEKSNSKEEILNDIADIAFNKKIIKDKEIFIERLSYLFNSTQIYHASKANELEYQYGNVYLNSRVISDIRVVFSNDVEQLPKGAMITHSLHLHYLSDQEGDHKDIYFALDSSDLRTLKDAIVRAESKEKSLKAILEKANLTNLKE
jgi:chaperonin cofactor prefoldin